MECPLCHNGLEAPKCKHCGGDGTVEIKGCPVEFVGRELWRGIDMARMVEHGVMPVAGGVLDQTESFLQLRRAYNGEVSRLREESK